MSYQNNSGSFVSLPDLNEQQSPNPDYVSYTTSDGTTTTTDWQSLVIFTAAGSTATLKLVTGTTSSDSYLTLPPTVQIQEARPVTTYAYNADGTLKSETDPLGNVTTYGYDADGNQTSVALPAPATGDYNPPDSGESGPDYSPITTYTYDLVGNLLSTTSPSPMAPAT